jgi:hypothetical protein
VDEILRLRRAERVVNKELRGELRSVREYLEDLVGPTVSRAEAARLFGMSQNGLERWIAKGEIPTVITPRGRREVPLYEVLELREALDELPESRATRPLASVVRERNLQSAKAIDVDRLLPRRRPRGHRVADLQALAYHRLVAERLDERIVDEARRNLRRGIESGRLHPEWAAEWDRILRMPLPQIAKRIGADSSRARELRQTSPFAGVLTEQERQRLLRAVEDRVA